MPQLKDVAKHVRSKNAGPFWVTIDIFCDDADSYATVATSPALRPAAIGALYGVDPATIRIFPKPDLRVVKISFPRRPVAGSLRDRDAHAGQYFMPLLSVEVGNQS